MTNNTTWKLGHLIVCIGICVGFVLTAPLAAAAESMPESYNIDGVPLYQQIDARGCGAASLQMVFDYYGPFIDQMEIYNAARSGGTPLPDMARAAQFSWMSTTAGSRFENSVVTGYSGRAIGYAGFYYAATEPWLDQLKFIVSQGYPVIVLVWWAPGYAGGDHYRVIVGYDDVEGVLIINDPWSREFKTDSEYYGSTSQSANGNGQDTSFVGVKWKYEDFLWTWQCPTTRWGVPDLAYGAVFVAPWQVVISAPEKVTAGERFKVVATITYPCIAPFGSDQFPMFTAQAFDAKLNPGDGFSIKKGPVLSSISTLGAGQSVELSWTLVAKNTEGTYSFDITTTGMVSESLGPWHDYPSYDYEDMIGGMASFEVIISL